MPASRKSDGPTEGSKMTKTLKRNTSDIKINSPKKKKKTGRTTVNDDAVSITSTLPDTLSTIDIDTNESIVDINCDTGDEGADSKLSTSSSSFIPQSDPTHFIFIRVLEKGLDFTNLCLLPAYPKHRP